jgi:orotidine-5'-phosphate decarboxylase
MKTLTLPERLIVAADFEPPKQILGEIPLGQRWVKQRVLELADKLKGTGVIFKVNSALRACGYDLIDELHARGLRVFADLKLSDIKNTLKTDGVLLREAKPEILTVMCTTGGDEFGC